LVTEIPGTTRDAIEAHTDFLGWPVRLADTAGLQDATDRVERLGIEVSHRYLAAADLVLLCSEAGRPLAMEEAGILERRSAILVRTKADLVPQPPSNELAVSSLTGQGLGALRRVIAERIFGDRLALADLEPALTRERHREALARAREALADAQPQLGPAGDPVLVAHHVRRATLALDELVGVIDVEDVLAGIFASFCVGK
jgi:tRNA modification GTPase